MALEKYLYRITLPYCCAGVITYDNIVCEYAPILKWTRGWNIADVKYAVKKYGGTVEVVDDGD